MPQITNERMAPPYTDGIPKDLQVRLAEIPLDVWLMLATDIRRDLSDEELTIAWNEFRRMKRYKEMQ